MVKMIKSIFASNYLADEELAQGFFVFFGVPEAAAFFPPRFGNKKNGGT